MYIKYLFYIKLKWKRLALLISESDASRVVKIKSNSICRHRHPEVFLRKGVCKFTGEYPYRSMTSIKLLCNKVVRTSAWVFSCKFAAYFQNTFYKEHLWAAASAFGWRPLDIVDSTLFFSSSISKLHTPPRFESH